MSLKYMGSIILGYVRPVMEGIMDLTQLVTGVTLTKVCSIKADKDSDESKTITLSIRFDGVPLQAVFDKAVSSAVIQWQNGPGRSKFDQWADKQVVKVDFKSPAKTTVDPKAALIAEAKTDGIDVTDKKALSDWLKEKFGV